MAVLDESVWAERREVVRRLRESGLLGTEFARREGISYNTLKGWIKRLRELERTEFSATFAEVVVQRDEVTRRTEPTEHPQIEVLLPTGETVRVYTGVDVSLLRIALEALRS